MRDIENRNKRYTRKRRKSKLSVVLFAILVISTVAFAAIISVIVTWITYYPEITITLLHPSDNQTINTNTTYFNWTASGGNATLWYVWYADTNPTFVSPNLRVVDVNITRNYTANPFMDGDWYWRVEVTDNWTLNVSATYHFIILTNISNHFPNLTDPSVNPTSGDTSNTFVYNVTFTDLDNNSADYVRVYIDDIPYNMTESDPLDTNTSDGKVYLYSTTLGRGFHNYSFTCSDGVAINSTDVYDNPVVYGVVQLSDEYPENESVNIPIPPNNFSIYVCNANGSNMDIYLYWINGTTYELVNQTTGVSNGTYLFYNTSWVTDLNTTYYWTVNVTNGFSWTNDTYHFTTIDTYAPIILEYYPLNNSVLVNVTNLFLSVTIFSNNLSTMNITWYTNYTGVWHPIGNTTNVTNGIHYQLAPILNENDTKVFWSVNITDSTGLNTTSPIYNYRYGEIVSMIGGGYWMLGVAMIFSMIPLSALRKRRKR